MFNNKQYNVTQSSSFVDEFDTESAVSTAVAVEEDIEAVKFNSKISENFDKIIHYDNYAYQTQIKETENVYRQYTQGVNVDVVPSSTTMQFEGVSKADIYKDVRKETYSPSQTTTSLSSKSKLMVVFATAVIIMLSILVIFNTILLKSMNGVITEKQTQIESLIEQNSSRQAILDEVKSDETILEKAYELGMK